MTGRRSTLFALALLFTHALQGMGEAQQQTEDAQYANLFPEQTDSLAAPEQTGSDPIVAGELFVEGRALYRTGDYAAACATFERSRQLNTTVAVLLNLGLCYRQLGRLATAHRYYRRAEVLATLNGDRRRELAHNEAATLAQLRASLELQLSEPADDLEVRIDGVRQSAETWSRPMFIDAGEHTISIQARAGAPWTGTVQIKDGDQHTLIVPPLSARTGIERIELPKPAPASAPLNPRPPISERAGLSTTRVVALATGAAGLASLGVGLMFGAFAQDAFSDSDPYCPEGDGCWPPGLEHRQRAVAHATRATVFSIAGVVALTGGVILWIVSPSSPRGSPEFANRAGSVTLTATE